MTDESVKVQMFRFVDVLPMLHGHQAITRHLQEYFDEVRTHLPWAVRLGLEISQPNTVFGKAPALNARRNALRMSERFIAGEGGRGAPGRLAASQAGFCLHARLAG